jgi:hypothetical protein
MQSSMSQFLSDQFDGDFQCCFIKLTPSNTLSCPIVTSRDPQKTTKYLLTAVNDGGCATTDSIRSGDL